MSSAVAVTLMPTGCRSRAASARGAQRGAARRDLQAHFGALAALGEEVELGVARVEAVELLRGVVEGLSGALGVDVFFELRRFGDDDQAVAVDLEVAAADGEDARAAALGWDEAQRADVEHGEDGDVAREDAELTQGARGRDFFHGLRELATFGGHDFEIERICGHRCDSV